MKKEISGQLSVGKTISRFLFSKSSGQVAIIFSDDSFTTIEIKKESFSSEDTLRFGDMDWFEFGWNKDLYEAGLLTPEEWKRICSVEDLREKEETRSKEFKQYIELKAKFEGI